VDTIKFVVDVKIGPYNTNIIGLQNYTCAYQENGTCVFWETAQYSLPCLRSETLCNWMQTKPCQLCSMGVKRGLLTSQNNKRSVLHAFNNVENY